MAVFKCKMCGGSLEITDEQIIVTCDYCSTQQTLPKIDNDKKLALFNRANNLRFKNEFDKAAGIYESIIAEFPDEAEAYWGLVLCKYGIEYVEDVSGCRIPTCHRTLPVAIMEDDDFQQACENADITAKNIYRDEAKAIDKIQKKILNIALNEEPYDIFICYKETDDITGLRTEDSLIAQDIYTQLLKDGYRIFFSRITLREVAGTEYEPYIYAALSSAKIMLAIGTKHDYYDAVWVKNEWSRFISMMGEDSSKVIIPCFKNMDAYDMPKEFKNMQGLDMGDVTFFGSLIDNIKKVISKDVSKTVKETVVVNSNNSQPEPLLKRAYMFLEDGDWNSADEYCEKVLDIDPENASAYLGKLMAELRVKKQGDLKNLAKPFNEYNNCQKALRFANEKLKNEIISYNDFILNRNLNDAYNNALGLMNNAKTVVDFREVAVKFEELGDFKNSKELVQECYSKAEIASKELIYQEAYSLMNNAKTESHYMVAAEKFSHVKNYKDSSEMITLCQEKSEVARKDDIYEKAKLKMNGEEISDYKSAIQLLKTISDWRDSADKILDCEKKIEEIKEILKCRAEEEQKALEVKQKRDSIITAGIMSGIVVLLVFFLVLITIIIPNIKYNSAIDLMSEGKYQEALSVFEEISGHKDSGERIKECSYNYAVVLMGEGDYKTAKQIFETLGKYKDCADKIEECKPAMYDNAVALINDNNNGEAFSLFYELGDYKDSRRYVGLLLQKRNARSTLSTSHHTVALKSDGTVVATGYNYGGQCDVGHWRDIVAVSAGFVHTVGLQSDGTVVAVGKNGFGQCDVGEWTDIIAISAGGSHTVGVKSDGTVVATGENDEGQCNVSEWRNIVAVSANSNHTVGLKSDGTVVATGENDEGQCDVSGWTDIVAVFTGYGHTLGLKADGTVVATGYNNSGQCNVSEWKDIVSITADEHVTIGVKYDGTVVVAGSLYLIDETVADWSDIVSISTDIYHTVALKSDGTVIGSEIGNEDYKYGQCNVENWKDIKQP